MIQILYRPEQYHIQILGHAQSAPYGHDLICASVSILTYTLAAFIQKLQASGHLADYTVSLQNGHAILACTPFTTISAAPVFDTICMGFQILAENFPENVMFRRE